MTPFSVRNRFAGLLVALSVFAAAISGCGDNNIGVEAESIAALAGAAGGPGFFDGSPSDPVRFDSPSGAAVVGTNLFIADNANHVIRKVDTVTRNVTTFAGKFGVSGSADDPTGTGTAARFNSPTGITTDGTFLFVTDTGNDTIRKIVISSGATTTLAGSPGTPGSTDGTAAARFNSPTGIAFDASSSSLFVADTGNHTIRQVTLTGSTTTFAGTAGVSGFANGTGPAVQFTFPQGVAVAGTTVYIADTGNHMIRQAVPSGIVGDVTTLAGVPGSPGSGDTAPGPAQFNSPGGIATDGSDLFVADTGNNTIRRVTTSGTVTTLAGLAGNTGSADGTTGSDARFNAPKGIGTLFSGGSNVFYVADTGNATIRQVTLAGVVTTVAGNPPQAGSIDGTGTAARFRSPAMGMAVVGDNVFVSDTGNGTIRKITPSGVVSTVPGTAGVFASPAGIAAIGTTLYVCDNVNHTISSLPAGGGTVTILAGLTGNPGSSDGSGSTARFSAPQGIATDGTDLYVVDAGNNAIRKVTTAGAVTTLAGSVGQFDDPRGIAFLNDALYVSDTGDHMIRKVLFPSGTVSDFAGSSGNAGLEDRTGTEARFSSPTGITAVDSVLYVSDTGNHAVRRISTLRKVTTFVGNPGAATTRNGDSNNALLNAPTGITGVEGTIYFTDINENVVRKILF